MHRCGTNANMAAGAYCSCGMYQCQYYNIHNNTNSFSMMFSNGGSNGHNQYMRGFDEENVDYYSSSPASVDCTLSLGTPSTRLSSSTHNNGESGNINHNMSSYHQDTTKKRSSLMSGFGWNILQSKHNASAATAVKSQRNGGGGGGGGDPLLARRCANCDTTSTPLWRNGPRGPKSLCNACGIRFKKEERRATAVAGTNNGGGANQYSGGGVDGSNWTQAQKVPCYSTTTAAYGSNEYRFIDEHDDHHHHQYQYYNHHHRDSVDSTNYPFLSWRFNVTDRPSLVHDFTR